MWFCRTSFIKIELQDSPYPVWRRIVTSGKLSLNSFIHQMIAAMGFLDCHMHLLQIGDREFMGDGGGVDGMFARMRLSGTPLDARNYRVLEVLKKGDQANLVYDFGDNWCHTVTVEKIYEVVPEDMRVPSCLEGEGGCPPEDCGGTTG